MYQIVLFLKCNLFLFYFPFGSLFSPESNAFTSSFWDVSCTSLYFVALVCCIAAALLLFYDIHHQLSCTAFPKREGLTSLNPFHSRLHNSCFGGPDKTSDNKASLSRHQHKNTLLLYLITIVAFDMTTMYHHCYTLNISKRLSYICFGRLLPSFFCYE